MLSQQQHEQPPPSWARFHTPMMAVIGSKLMDDVTMGSMIGKLLKRLGGVDERTLEKYEKEYSGGGFRYCGYYQSSRTDTYFSGLGRDFPVQHDYLSGFIQVKQDPKGDNRIALLYSGHKRSPKTMLKLCLLSDIRLLLINASNIDLSTDSEVIGEYIRLSAACGMKNLIIAVNCEASNTSTNMTSQLDQLLTTLHSFLEKCRMKADNYFIIPFLLSSGDGLIEPIEPPHPKFTKKALVQVLVEVREKVVAEMNKVDVNHQPLRATVMQVHKIGGIGTVVECKVLSGSIRASDNVDLVLDSGEVVKKLANSIEHFHTSIPSAFPGDFCGINLKGVAVKNLQKGMIIGNSSNLVTYFEANIVVHNAPEKGFRVGWTPTLHVHAAHCTCQIEEIMCKLDGNMNPIGPMDELKRGTRARVKIRPFSMLQLEEYSKCPPLGKIVLVNSHEIIAFGAVVHCKRASYSLDHELLC
ncbi:hypothetical protein C9374_007968 [Naegleria lovaniensis]|uniref:Uncharacterized protein n=1 Tax=Naegleria lovaniensis TaxID=51637 RepID=A0AA88KGQ4_NAELO|nr:uncharacterized protein C9374_007968 [Naegleria lovaniensis]KAG2378820.1 hypothetical protein C9374_007968 [Naegleria lovaniensis]